MKKKNGMKKLGAVLVATLLTVGVAQSGSAASIEVCAGGVCATGETAELGATVGQQIVFTVGLDASTPINGYELFFSYDPTELAPSYPSYDPAVPESAHQLYADALFQPDTFPFTVAPFPCADPANCRVSQIGVTPFATSGLFEITFDVVGVTGDGQGDFLVFGGGLGGNPAPELLGLPAGISVVPEPGTLALLGFGMAGLALGGRRRR